MDFEQAKQWLHFHDIEIERARQALIKVTWDDQVSFVEESFLTSLVQLLDFVHTNSWNEGHDQGGNKR